MIGQMDSPLRPFKPTGTGGGSKPGKPQSLWPLVLLVGADAIILQAKGTQESWVKDRKRRIHQITFQARMDALFPGWESFVIETMPARTSKRIDLLANRVYKMYYSGTSDRGDNHDPLTRACESGEHWRKRVPLGSPLHIMHEGIARGLIMMVSNWRDYL
jgi:hypothetical protein